MYAVAFNLEISKLKEYYHPISLQKSLLRNERTLTRL